MLKLNFRGHTSKKTCFSKNRKFTFFWKYFVCGFKIEISEYLTKVSTITNSPYKHEVNRTKTHEIRTKSTRAFFVPLNLYPALYKNVWNLIFLVFIYPPHGKRRDKTSARGQKLLIFKVWIFSFILHQKSSKTHFKIRWDRFVWFDCKNCFCLQKKQDPEKLAPKLERLISDVYFYF